MRLFRTSMLTIATMILALVSFNRVVDAGPAVVGDLAIFSATHDDAVEMGEQQLKTTENIALADMEVVYVAKEPMFACEALTSPCHTAASIVYNHDAAILMTAGNGFAQINSMMFGYFRQSGENLVSGMTNSFSTGVRRTDHNS